MHALVKLLAESRVAARSRARGYEVGDGEYSFVVGQVRRVLSCSFVRSQALCLLARLGQVGAGARGAADRRAGAQRAEHVRRQEAEGAWLANVRGMGVTGMVFIP